MRKNRLEIITIILIFIFTLIISIILEPYIENLHERSLDYAQILAEIIAFVFILPQVIIQLSIISRREDVKSVFSGCIPFYLGYYLIILLILSLNCWENFSNSYWHNLIILFTYISAILLIFPYLFFLINKYSADVILRTERRNITNMIFKVSQLNNKDSNNRDPKILENEIMTAVRELRDYVIAYSERSYIFYVKGINALTETIEQSFKKGTQNIDNILIEIIEILINIGFRIENDASRLILVERVSELGLTMIKEQQNEARINLLVTRMINLLENMTINGSKAASSDTVKTLLKQIDNIVKKCIRNEPVIKIEFHLIAETYKRLCIYSMAKNYEMCARDAIENLSYLCIQSMKKIPEQASVNKICEAYKEIGVRGAEIRNEILCIQIMNRFINIIIEFKNRYPDNEIEACMASLLEFVAYFWHGWSNVPKMRIWLRKRLNRMKRENRIPHKKYFRVTQKILEVKSMMSSNIFSDFVDEYNGEQFTN